MIAIFFLSLGALERKLEAISWEIRGQEKLTFVLFSCRQLEIKL